MLPVAPPVPGLPGMLQGPERHQEPRVPCWKSAQVCLGPLPRPLQAGVPGPLGALSVAALPACLMLLPPDLLRAASSPHCPITCGLSS